MTTAKGENTPQTLEQPMTLEDENRRLKEILLRLLEGVKQNDASPGYEYSGKRATRPFDGKACPTGRWLTPREIAGAWELDPLVRRIQREAGTPTASLIDGERGVSHHLPPTGAPTKE